MKPSASVKGWCPGAYRPMMSGDGLIVRVRPFCARLTAPQVLGLCALAQEYGSGFIDLTNRANLQIRGVAEGTLDTLLNALADLHLLDETPALESRRNILTTPFWFEGEETQELYQNHIDALSDLPELPAKFGISIDTGAAPILTQDSADIRIERGPEGVLVRADGAALGRAVTKDTAISAVHEMAQWFAAHRRPDERRMASVLSRCTMPAEWTRAAAYAPDPQPEPGPWDQGALVGAAFGQINAANLIGLMQDTAAPALRVTPWRMVLLEGVRSVVTDAFVTHPGDPLLRTDACPGAPHCASASVETRALAQRLASQVTGRLHVSGCAKGCARKGPADATIVGNNGRFDLVLQGHAWDAPAKSGLHPQDLLAELTGQI